MTAQLLEEDPMKRMIHALLACACLTVPAFAQDKEVTLRASLWVPPAHPLVPSTKEWGESMTKASGGSIKMALFPSEQLGKAFDHYDMARDGIADVTYVNPGYQPGRFPIIAAGQLPFVFKDAKSGTAALDDWYRKYAAAEMKDVHYCFAFIHSPGTYHGKKKVVMPEDLKGVKVRPAQSTIGQLVTMLGGTNVQASAPEARDMLERGVADGLFFPGGSMFLFGLDKVTKYHISPPLYSTVFVYLFNKDKYAAMSAAQKKVIDDHCNNEWAVKMATPWGEFEAAGIEKLKTLPGHETVELNAEQIAAWKKTVDPLKKSWAEAVTKAGGNAEQITKDFEASLAKYKAAY